MNARSTFDQRPGWLAGGRNDKRPRYPGKVAIKHAIAAARTAGIDVAGVEVSADGTIRVVEARAIPAAPATLFDELETAGKL